MQTTLLPRLPVATSCKRSENSFQKWTFNNLSQAFFSVIPTLQVLLDVSMPFFFADDVTSLAVHSSTVVFYFENWIV